MIGCRVRILGLSRSYKDDAINLRREDQDYGRKKVSDSLIMVSGFGTGSRSRTMSI